MKTYLLVAALTFGALALPAPASAINCLPVDSGELVREARCLSGVDHIQCTGDAAYACTVVGSTADAAFDLGEGAENTARGLPNKVRGTVDLILP